MRQFDQEVPDVWAKVTAKNLGFPSLEACGGVRLDGRVVAWLPGMVAKDTADWYMITWHTGDLRRYVEAGGDMRRCVVHFLTYDVGVISPLWGKDSFKKRVDRMREFGVVNVVAPDFSSWADFPVVLQLHNYYRSAVVSSDLVRAGFGVIPNVCWSTPQTHKASIGMWAGSKTGTILVDYNHSTKSKIDRALFVLGAKEFKRQFTNRVDDVLIWSSAERAHETWSRLVGPGRWVPSRARMLCELARKKGLQNG